MNTTSPYRTANRAAFASISQSWRNLTEEERSSWIGAVHEYAKTDIFGDLRNPSGYNLYMKVNCLRVMLSLSMLTVAPSPIPCSLVLVSTYFIEAYNDYLYLEFWVTIVGYTHLYVKVSRPVSEGINYYKKYLVNVQNQDVVPNFIFESSDFFSTRFGKLFSAGEAIFVELIAVCAATGQSELIYKRKYIYA